MNAEAAPSTLDPAEAEKFARIAATWWDPAGPFAPLHRMNPVRLEVIRAEIDAAFGARRGPKPFEGLRVVDVGCGGGLATEPMARLGARVTGLDAAEETARVARAHAEAQGLAIEYRVGLVEDLAAERPGSADVVLALEIVEHVADLRAFAAACGRLLRPGGVAIFSTINRTLMAYGLAIVAAERVLRWVEPGSHHFEKLVKPEELQDAIRAAGLAPTPPIGLRFDPLFGAWRQSQDVRVNYMMTARRL